MTGVTNERHEPFNDRRRLLDDWASFERLAAVGLDDPVCVLEISFNARAEHLRDERIGHSNSAPSGLVFIRRADATQGRANLFISQAFFTCMIERAMIRQNQMRARAD